MTDLPDQPDEWSDADVIDAEVIDTESVGETETSLGVPEPIETPTRPAGSPEIKPTVYRGSGFRWSFVFGSLLVVLMLLLMFFNFQEVEFRFFTWKINAPLAVVILGTALIAVVIDELAGFVWRVRRRRQLKARAELKALRRETAPPKTSRFRNRK